MLLSTPKNTLFHFFSNLPVFVTHPVGWHMFCLTATLTFAASFYPSVIAAAGFFGESFLRIAG